MEGYCSQRENGLLYAEGKWRLFYVEGNGGHSMLKGNEGLFYAEEQWGGGWGGVISC